MHSQTIWQLCISQGWYQIMNKDTHCVDYVYKNCPVPGGGFVTGFLFHPKKENILYARTDIGGVYRYQFEEEQWICLIDHVTMEEQSECFPLSFAVNEEEQDSLYIVCGDKISGTLCISHDRGDTFTYEELPCGVHGNNPGRSTGERLLYKDNVLYFASQSNGLFISSDEGKTWTALDVCERKIGDRMSLPEKNLTFIWMNGLFKSIDGLSEFMLVGTSGEQNSPDKSKTRGCTLYYSLNNGKTFMQMPIPSPIKDSRCDIYGFVPQRVATDGKYLYVTFSAVSGTIFHNFDCYSCDTGGCFDGRLYRYCIKDDTMEITYEDITPSVDTFIDNADRKLRSGLSGIDTYNDVIILSTISHQTGDIIYFSKNRGETWEIILKGLEIGRLNFDVPYMKPEYNGKGSIVHWMSDIKINPYNPDMALFNTGTGVFKSSNLTNALKGDIVDWHSFCKGIEETVHLNVYGIPEGEVIVLDIIGDLGGFAFTDLDSPPENSFADDEGNRYITCLNADFTDTNPYTIAATPRGNWTGKTKGGIILTHDQCRTWKRLPDPYGISEEIDGYLDFIKRPNVDSGWVALSADGKRLLWCIQGKWIFPSSAVVFTDNEGVAWEKSRFYNLNKEMFDDNPCYVHVYADRVNPDIFYATGDHSRFFISNDKGREFYEVELPSDFPKDMFYKDRSFELRCEREREGIIWLSLGINGLYRLEYNTKNKTLDVIKVTKEHETAYCIGIGKAKEGSAYRTLFTNGRINGDYGFYRSHDYGKTWERINNDKQMFGSIVSISGDERMYGRFYLASGAKGLIYGVPDIGKL